jgi:hypothetical protein
MTENPVIASNASLIQRVDGIAAFAPKFHRPAQNAGQQHGRGQRQQQRAVQQIETGHLTRRGQTG